MIQIKGNGIFLSQSPLGEKQYIVRVFCAEHGLVSGVMQASAVHRTRWQPGERVLFTWRARLNEHLGKLDCERSPDQYILVLDLKPLAMQALLIICGLLQKSCSERHPEKELYLVTVSCLHAFSEESWPLVYLEWERAFLAKMGFGLDLSCCAADGCSEKSLKYLSPKSARAICVKHAEPFLAKVMELPLFWQAKPAQMQNTNVRELRKGFTITEHFIDREILQEEHAILEFRRNMLEKLYKSS